MTREQLDRLEQAEDILTALYWDIRDQRGCAREAKRLDTILGRINNLKHMGYEEVRR